MLFMVTSAIVDPTPIVAPLRRSRPMSDHIELPVAVEVPVAVSSLAEYGGGISPGLPLPPLGPPGPPLLPPPGPHPPRPPSQGRLGGPPGGLPGLVETEARGIFRVK